MSSALGLSSNLTTSDVIEWLSLLLNTSLYSERKRCRTLSKSSGVYLRDKWSLSEDEISLVDFETIGWL